MQPYRALVASLMNEEVQLAIQEQTIDDLPEGDVLIQVAYSSVNYKDALAVRAASRVVKSYPIVPGIDLAGTVAASRDPRFKEGDPVLVTGYELGVSHNGGYSEYARVPGDWVVPLPSGLTLREAMIYGTAGFTAALSIHRLQACGISPERGPLLVTGATGGVGSLALAMLAASGYEVTASTGKAEQRSFLERLGARSIIPREELTPERIRPLDSQRWAGAVDPVGGRSLAYILSTTKYGGAVAVSGLAGGSDLPATVYPFILRGVQLIGIDSVYCPMDERLKVWKRMAEEWKPAVLEDLCTEITLDQLPERLISFLSSQHVGRWIVRF